MVKINKGPEPVELIRYRQLSDASYQNMHGAPTGKVNPDGTLKDVYTVVLNSLLKEQGYICAYCMCRIPEKHSAATIEHIAPQSLTSKDASLDYRNMLAVCNGNRHTHNYNDKTCDAYRGNRPLSLNPLKSETLSLIRYKSNGIIYSDNSNVDRELNDILNLNCKARQLPNNRRYALNVLLSNIRKKYPAGSIKEYCQKEIARYESATFKEPYIGIILDWLERHSR